MASRAWVKVGGLLIALLVDPGEAGAQLRVEVLYGGERNVADGGGEHDGWGSATVEWVLPSGVGIGLGTDHSFEEASPSTANHQGWALFGTSSYTRRSGRWAPFVRVGIGAGRAPCRSDTCGDGLYLRGSAGTRLHLRERLGLVGEVGLTRVGRPFAGVGLSLRPEGV